jgi:hypothetical protein
MSSLSKTQAPQAHTAAIVAAAGKPSVRTSLGYARALPHLHTHP